MRRFMMLFIVGVFAGFAWATPSSLKTPVAEVSLLGANLKLKVADFSRGRQQVLASMQQYSGTVLNATTRVKANGDQYGTIVIRLPRTAFSPFLHDVRKVGILYSDDVQTRDKTSEYEMLSRRAALLRQNEEELYRFAHSPQRLRGSDVLYGQYRLYQTRMEIAQTQQSQQDLLRGNTRGTVEITLFEPSWSAAVPNQRNWWVRQVDKFGLAFLSGLRHLESFLLRLIASWPLLLCLAVVVWLGWGFRRRWQRRKAALTAE